MLPTALDDAAFRGAASALTSAMRAHDTTWNQLLKLLASSRRLSGDAEHLGDGSVEGARILGSALWRFSAITERFLIAAALPFAITDDADHLDAIRRFFLQPREAYSIDDLAALWQVHPGDVRDIYFDQLCGPAAQMRIPWADALGASVHFNMLRPFDIERALGAEFTQVRTELWRTVPILIHLPRFVADAVTRDAAIPATLALDLRIERFLMEHFASGSDDSGTVLRRRSE